MVNYVRTDPSRYHTSSKELTGKPYTGEWYDQIGVDTESYEEPIKPFPSDTECLCLVEVEGGGKEPDYACRECEGTGKRRFFSLYEKTIKEKQHES